MNTQTTKMLLLTINVLSILFISSAFAGDPCESAFGVNELKGPFTVVKKKPGPIQVNALGEPDLGHSIHRDAVIVAEVAAELGLATPGHQLNIVPSDQLNIMAVSGADPAPHWHDGANVLSGLERVQGVLEFVTKGCPTCRAFYSASTPPMEQRSVVMHVAGHNDMSETSIYQKIRPGDGPLASYQLADTLGKFYRQYGHDEVSLYFQRLKSLGSLQDFTHGTFEDPSKFSPSKANLPLKPEAPRSFWDALGTSTGLLDAIIPTSDKKATQETHWKETTSVLQAMTENLPGDVQEWQKSLIKLYEQSQRAYPGNFQTKIMNEGWATLMMYVLARHLPWTQSADLVKFGQLLSGVAVPSFSNPYWLGLSGWNNLYLQFKERPEITNLPEMEKDKRFIAWAREMYANKNDSEWAKIALDQRWIEKNNFFLYRKMTRPEMQATGGEKDHITLSRDWKRIRNFIITKHIDTKYKMIPSLALVNPGITQGFFVLRQNNMIENFPLHIGEAAKTAFVIAQIVQKPVQVDALFSLDGVNRAQLTVNVDGKVSVTGKLEGISTLNEPLENLIATYNADVLASFQTGLADDITAKRWEQMATQVGDFNSIGASQIVEYAPHTSGAVREYLHTVEGRLRASLEDMLQGKTSPKFSKKGVRVSVLPQIPEFRYDPGYMGKLTATRPAAPVDYPGPVIDHDFDIDGNTGSPMETKIASGTKLPGDIFAIPKKEGQGKGKGEGESDEGEPEEGEGEPQEGESQQPGEEGSGAANPGEIDIPLKLYGELLAEVLELPNIRRTKGKIPDTETIRRGRVQKPTGYQLWDDTIINAIEKARALRKAKGLPFDASVPVYDLIREALPLIEPSDIVVAGRMTKPIPDFDAVLIVNVDLTGSMSGERIKLAKNLLFNIKAMLEAKYKKVTIVYVGFDSTARELSEKQIFSQFFGGGTNYASATELDKKIIERYPRSQYNKYILTLGDGETTQPDAEQYIQDISDMRDDLQYAGMAQINEQDANGPFSPMPKLHANFKEEWPWIGFTHMKGPQDMMKGLKELFRGDKN